MEGFCIAVSGRQNSHNRPRTAVATMKAKEVHSTGRDSRRERRTVLR